MQHWIGAGRYDLEFVVGPVWQEEIVIAQYQEELSILTSGRIPVIKPGITACPTSFRLAKAGLTLSLNRMKFIFVLNYYYKNFSVYSRDNSLYKVSAF